jgi:hypothetical protein
VLALGTAQRNAAAAFVVAGQNFDDAKVIVMITVVLIVEFLMLLPFARMRGLIADLCPANHPERAWQTSGVS